MGFTVQLVLIVPPRRTRISVRLSLKAGDEMGSGLLASGVTHRVCFWPTIAKGTAESCRG